MVFLTKLKPEPMGAHSLSVAYGVNSLVMSDDGAAAYISVKDVPAGTPLSNTDYWQPHTDLSAVVQSAEAAAQKANAARDEMLEISRNLTDIVEKSGNPVQTELVGGLPFDRVATALEPIQSGSGDPYPAGGGKNLCPGIEIGLAYINADGSDYASSDYKRTKKIPITDGTIYSYSSNDGSLPNDIHFWDKNGNWLTVYNDGIVRINNHPEGAAYMAFNYYRKEELSWVQVEKGSIATEYAPYANIRPISGWTDAKLTRCGKNLWNGKISYEESGTPDLCGYTDPITIAVKFVSGTSQFNYRLIYTDGTDMNFMFAPASFENGVWRSVNISPEKPLRSIHFTSIDAATTRSVDKIMVMFGTCTVTDEIYAPPQTVEEFSASFGQTVYGGTLDWMTGVLTVDKAMVAFDGTENFTTAATNTSGKKMFNYALPGAMSNASNATISGFILCSHYAEVSPNSTYKCNIGVSLGAKGVISIYDDAYAALTLDDFKSYLSAQAAAGTPVQIAYKLATPTTIQLTPQEIRQLQGVNTLYGDGSISIAGRANPAIALDARIAALEAAALAE